MTAVDHAARIAAILHNEGDGGIWEHFDRANAETVARALVAAGIGVLPEAEVTEEWNVLDEFGTPCAHNGGWRGWNARNYARQVQADIGGTVARRTRTRYAEHVTEWEAVEPRRAGTGNPSTPTDAMSTPLDDRDGATQVIAALLSAGWGLTAVYDGEEDVPVTSIEEALDAIFAVDQAYLHVTRQQDRGWVFFVLGNDPDEVVCDHTVNLSPVLDPLMDGWWA